MKYLIVNHKKDFSEIVFNNDNRRNSLSTALLTEFCTAIDEVCQISSKVLIIRANKDSKVWSAGFNIEELPLPGTDPVPYDHPLEVLVRHLQKVKIPIIAMMEGSVWGGGCDIALSCDLLIGTPQTSFAITPAKIGVPYNTNGILRILNIVQPNIAKELFFTAQPLSAQRAYDLGILNHLVEVNNLESFTYELVERIAKNSPLAISVIKRQINLISGNKNLSPGMIEEINALREIAYNSEDYLEGINAFKERRKPEFRGK